MQNKRFCTKISHSLFNGMCVLNLCPGKLKDKCQEDKLNTAVLCKWNRTQWYINSSVEEKIG